MPVSSIIRLIRPQQWVKNGFVFLPMFFSGRLLDGFCWRQSILSFFAFSFAASAVYCLNDIRDVEADKLHPRKRNRPVASGDVSMSVASVIMTVMGVIALAIGFLALGAQGLEAGSVLAAYLVLNVLYCLRLKRFAIVDVFIISLGFVLRLMMGGLACEIWMSPWIVCLTFLLALFLAFAKRRDDVVILEATGVVTRGNVLKYNLPFLNQTLGIIGAVTIMCYLMYSVSPEVVARLDCEYVYVTSIFVLAGILRYLQIAIVDVKSGSPTKVLLKDRFVQGCIVCWVISFATILYL